MRLHSPSDLVEALSSLRHDLLDLAVNLDRRGHCEAADVAVTTAARLAELCEEFTAPAATPISGQISRHGPKPAPVFVESM